MRRLLRLILLVCGLTSGFLSNGTGAHATIVRFDTNLGSILVRLYDTATPITTNNFLAYVNANSWDNSFIHRSVSGFVVQGGGYKLDPDIFNTVDITSFAPIQNEFGISNLRGTIAMAKLGGDPNSATNEWFFNLANNSANLDNQNGGFTVFGRITSGLSVIDDIAALDIVSAGEPFTNVPVLDFDKVIAQNNILAEDAVIVSDVSVLSFPDADYDFNHKVAGQDFIFWQRTFGSTTVAVADGNGNGVVDVADLSLWQAGYGASSATSTTAAVPEPATLALAGGFAWLLVARRFRRRATD